MITHGIPTQQNLINSPDHAHKSGTMGKKPEALVAAAVQGKQPPHDAEQYKPALLPPVVADVSRIHNW